MSETPGKAASKRQSDPWPIVPTRQPARPQFGGRLTVETLLGTARGRHTASVAGRYGGRNKAEVPAFKYAGT